MTDNVGIEIKRENFDWLYRSANIGAYTPKARKSRISKPKMAPVAEACPNVKWSETKKSLWVRFNDANGKQKTVPRTVNECNDDERNEKMFVDTSITLQGLCDSASTDNNPHSSAACSK